MMTADDLKQIGKRPQETERRRLFIAAALPDELLKPLNQARLRLDRACVRASLSRAENLHCTLRFIGEVEPDECAAVTAWFRTLKTEEQGRLTAALADYGYFSTPDGLTVWGGLQVSPAWRDLLERIEVGLRPLVRPAKRAVWKPHVTLARRVRLDRPFEELGKTWPRLTQAQEIREAVLFLSERTAGGMRYTPLEILQV